LRKSARFEVFCAYLAFFVWSGHALKKKKEKEKKSHTTRIFHPIAGARPLIRNGPNLAVLVSGRT